ncbi:MAG: hypothetical protein M3458_07715 [Acidobacteriota bacterium]|nr:hypothetical protein [Acidobacteriota bacterium]
MGDVLLKAGSKPSDSLLWEIQKRSYITRNLLRYALIIRRSWEDRRALEKLVAGLNNYTVFREALPFLKGDREGIDESAYQRVVAYLSDTNSRETIEHLKRLKADQIGRQHKKGASVTAMRDTAVSFNTALAQLETEVSSDAPTAPISDELLMSLSRIAIAVASGDAAEKPPANTIDAGSSLRAVAENLMTAIRGGRASAAAFRKVIGAERLMQAADLLNSMRSEASLTEWRRRHATSVRTAN